MGAWPRVRGWTRTGGKRRLSPKAAAEPLGTEHPHREAQEGTAGPQASGVPSAKGNSSIGPGSLSSLKGRPQTFLECGPAHSDPSQPPSFASIPAVPVHVSPDLIKADSSISPSRPTALSIPQARFPWRSGPGASQPACLPLSHATRSALLKVRSSERKPE